MADGDGAVATRAPDALVKEIERTRESLARTIDALTERVSPRNAARRVVAQAREQAARPEAQRPAAAGEALARSPGPLTERVAPRNAGGRVVAQAGEQAARPEVQRAAGGVAAT